MHRVLVGLAVTCVLSACGTTSTASEPNNSAAPASPDPTRVLVLQRACAGVHVAYDALVAADPVSARVFEESLRRLSEIGVEETRVALAPVVEAAGTLAEADRDSFPQARDGVFTAISQLSDTCATLGVPILH